LPDNSAVRVPTDSWRSRRQRGFAQLNPQPSGQTTERDSVDRVAARELRAADDLGNLGGSIRHA
jgi:hypothetical protein